jgi:hypothetical protein
MSVFCFFGRERRVLALRKIQQIQGLQGVLKKSVLLKGTASAVPNVLCSQRGFSR